MYEQDALSSRRFRRNGDHLVAGDDGPVELIDKPAVDTPCGHNP